MSEDSESGRPAQVDLLSDTPLDDPRQDVFGFAVFAESLAYLIDDELTDTPITVAVSAPWGGGKTSVARMTDRLLRQWTDLRLDERPNVTCWFNAWTHNDAPHLGAALAAAVARTANARRPTWRRLTEPLPSSMLSPRERWRRRALLAAVSFFVLGVALLITPIRDWLTELPDVKDKTAGIGSLGVVVVALVLLWPRVFAAAEHAAAFIADPRSEAARGSMAQVGEQLARLVRHASQGGRFVIFVDDLERCSAERALEVCEMANQLLHHRGVVTVLVADMEAIASCAQQRYTDRDRDGSDSHAGRVYLEKIVQIQLTLPPPTTGDMLRLLRGQGTRRDEDAVDGAAG